MKYLRITRNYAAMKNSDIENIISTLKKKYKKISYPKRKPFNSLIRTILSQRTKDEQTDSAAERLFSVHNSPEELANADEKDIENLIKKAGFYRQKTKRIKEVSKIISKKYNGRVPDNIEELLTLPGVGRKTANCVLVFGFAKPAIPVDTHVHRISNRLGFVKTKKPDETEKMLIKTIPKKYWMDLNDLLVRFGQDICRPIGPKCYECPINDLCQFEKKSVRKNK